MSVLSSVGGKSRRVTVVHNPQAGNGSVSRSSLEAILGDHGYHVRYQSTSRRWKSALQQRADLVVAAGGDGTVRKVATELASRRPEVPLGVLPLGTANNVATALGIRGDLEDIVAAWSASRPVRLDLGLVRGAGKDRLFLEGVGGGIVAHAVIRGPAEVEESTSSPDEEARRAIDLLRDVVGTATPADWEIEADGTDCSGAYYGVEALNIGLVGHNVPLAERSDVHDGLLDLVVIGEEGRDVLLRYLDRRLGGDHAVTTLTGLPVRHFRHARIRPPKGEPFRIDDKSRPWDGRRRGSSVSVEVQPAAVSILGLPERGDPTMVGR